MLPNSSLSKGLFTFDGKFNFALLVEGVGSTLLPNSSLPKGLSTFDDKLNFALAEVWSQRPVEHSIVDEGAPSRLDVRDSVEAGSLLSASIKDLGLGQRVGLTCIVNTRHFITRSVWYAQSTTTVVFAS